MGFEERHSVLELDGESREPRNRATRRQLAAGARQSCEQVPPAEGDDGSC